MANLNTINARIETLKNAERVTKAELGSLSRELLEYVMLDKSYDIDAVNRTIAVLTPMNKKTAVLFFNAFLPFQFDEETNTFGKMQKKHVAKKVEAITTWLEDEGNSIWTWAADNVKVEAKEVDWAKKISKDITKAKEAGTDNTAILRAVVEGGLTITDIMTILEQAAEKAEEQQAEAA